MKKPNKTAAIARLRRACERISALKSLASTSSSFGKWKRDTAVAVQHTFGKGSSHAKEFRAVRYMPYSSSAGYKQRAYNSGLESAKVLLTSMIDEIDEYWDDDTIDDTPPPATQERTVFVIHGRDDGTKHTIARFLEKLDLKPVILNEEPNRGRTIIEKVEDYGLPSFAVAILTPDDVGALASDTHDMKQRARQNVIFEFGYFIGKIGREKVCAIIKEEPEIPSDYSGVVYISFDDAGAWEKSLFQELNAAELNVDPRRFFGES